MGETVEIPQKDGSTKVVTKGEFLSSKLFQLAASGDLGAIKICLDNVDGPPAQPVELMGPDGGPIKAETVTKVTFVRPEKKNG